MWHSVTLTRNQYVPQCGVIDTSMCHRVVSLTRNQYVAQLGVVCRYLRVEADTQDVPSKDPVIQNMYQAVLKRFNQALKTVGCHRGTLNACLAQIIVCLITVCNFMSMVNWLSQSSFDL